VAASSESRAPAGRTAACEDNDADALNTVTLRPSLTSGQDPSIAVVIPNWNGRPWLPDCLAAIRAQTRPATEVIVVDNGSHDGSVELLREEHPEVTVVALAGKMLSLQDPSEVDDAGDVLRRDGACEQRGRFHRDDGSWDEPGEVFGACAGAALYRRRAVADLGGFDERLFAYLEDVDLALRLRLAGWRCRYEPAESLHAGGGSAAALPDGHEYLVQRNTLVLVARYFPWRWLPQVAYRQMAWARHAHRQGILGRHLRATAAALPMVYGALRARGEVRAWARVPIGQVVPARPIRGPKAGGHRRAIEASWR